MSDPVGPINHQRTRALEMGEASRSGSDRDVSSAHARSETYSSKHIFARQRGCQPARPGDVGAAVASRKGDAMDEEMIAGLNTFALSDEGAKRRLHAFLEKRAPKAYYHAVAGA